MDIIYYDDNIIVAIKPAGVISTDEPGGMPSLLRQALGRLPEREKQIVSMRFGLGGRREKTQKEVADLMGISQSYISRLEKRIMLRLRREISRQIFS